MATARLKAIDTAPKDGKVHMLVWAPNGRIDHKELARWDRDAGAWRPVNNGGFCIDMTHWHPPHSRGAA